MVSVVFITPGHPPLLQRNKQFLSLLPCPSLTITFLMKLQVRTVKATGLEGSSDMGEWVQSEAYLPLG